MPVRHPAVNAPSREISRERKTRGEVELIKNKTKGIKVKEKKPLQKTGNRRQETGNGSKNGAGRYRKEPRQLSGGWQLPLNRVQHGRQMLHQPDLMLPDHRPPQIQPPHRQPP